MTEKTQRVTLEDLAGMIQRGFAEVATKSDLERVETNVAKELVRIHAKLDQLPTRQELTDLLALRQDIDAIRRGIRDKLHVDV